MIDREWKRLAVFGAVEAVFLALFSIPYARTGNTQFLSLLMLTPAVSVVLVRIFTREGTAELWLRPHFRRGWKWDAAAYFLPPVIAYLGALAFFLLFPGKFDPMASVYALQSGASSLKEYGGMLLAVVPLAVLINPVFGFISTFGEEFAWRGYIFPKLCKKLPPFWAALLTNAVWGLWHAPVILTGYNYGTEHPVLGVFAMVLFCVVIGGILCWLVQKTGSVWVAVIGHAALNGIDKYAPATLLTDGNVNLFLGPNPVGLIGGIGFVVLAVICYAALFRDGGVRTKTVC